MPFEPESIRLLIGQFGYPIVAAVIIAENLFLPAPSQTTVLIAGALAAAGTLDPWVLAIVVALSAFVGDNIGFGIGHFGGERLVERFGARVGLTSERQAQAHGFMERWGGPAVVVGRFIAFVRILVPPLLGTSGMSWRRFVAWDAVAAALWGTAIVAFGYFGASGAARLLAWLQLRLGVWGIAIGLVALALVVAGAIVAARKLRLRALDTGDE